MVGEFDGNSLVSHDQQFKKLLPHLLHLLLNTYLAFYILTYVLTYLTCDFLFQSLQEAQCLANQVEMYYCNPSESKKSLLETFTFKPQDFKHQDLVDQLENLSLLTESMDLSAKAKK